MTQRDEWELCRVYTDRGAAEVLCARLVLEGVPAQIDAHGLDGGVESQYSVIVPVSLAHRARWILAQLPPSEEELEFLATGRLPGQE